MLDRLIPDAVQEEAIETKNSKRPRGLNKEEALRYLGWNVTDAGCWEFKRIHKPSGYGNFGYGDKIIKAHRAAYEVWVGPIPNGLMVCHTCDNPPCINPEHLFLGTQADNMADMVNKGRADRHAGVNNGRAKLTLNQVEEIRSLLLKKVPKRQIARKYDVSPTAITRIEQGTGWIG